MQLKHPELRSSCDGIEKLAKTPEDLANRAEAGSQARKPKRRVMLDSKAKGRISEMIKEEIIKRN